MTLIWSPESSHDLIALRAHIAEQDPAAAKRVALHILYCVEYLLSENRKLGAPGRAPGTRELVVPKTPYIVPYRVRSSRIEIARVYHSSRRWPDRLQRSARDHQPIAIPSCGSCTEPDQCFELIIASVTYPNVSDVINTKELRGFRRHH
jgi:toxin ParE1/3/4